MRLLSWDTESWVIAQGRPIPPMCCISFCEPGKEPTLHHVNGSGLDIWLDAVNDPETLVIGHNVMFDLAVCVDSHRRKEDALRAVFRALSEGRVRDTLIRQKIFHIRKGDLQRLRKGDLTLGNLSKIYLGEEMEKDEWRLRYSEFVGLPLGEWPEGAKKYAKDDARQTLRVFLAQEELFTKMNYRGKEPLSCRDEAFQLRAAWALHLMGAWGIRTDPEKVERLEKELTQEIVDHTKTLQGAAIIRLDGSQHMAVLEKRIVEAYKSLGKPFPTTAGWDKLKAAEQTDEARLEYVKTSKEALEAVVHIDPLLRAVHERKHAEKILNTFVDVAKRGVIHPITASFNPLVATTRTSCTKPNLQNLPKKDGVRECFRPREGNVFIDADYKVLEMCTFAQTLFRLKLPDVLRQAIIQKKDPHSMLGGKLKNISYEDFLARRAADDDEIETMRDVSKSANFALMGGLGPQKLRAYIKAATAKGDFKGIDIPLEEAVKIKQGWAETWQTDGYFRWVNSLINPVTELATVPLFSGIIRGAAKYTVAANLPFQSTAAYGAKETAWNLCVEMYLDRRSELYGCRNVNFVHDQFIVEAPEENADPAARRLKQLMIEGMMVWTPDVPIDVDLKVSRVWSKKSKPVFNEEGEFIPWDTEEEEAA